MKRLIYKIRKKLVRSCGNDINYTTMKKMISDNNNIKIIDVRTNDEYKEKHINGAINIPLHEISEKVEKIVINKNDVIIVYCQYGGRSRKALSKLEKLGYLNVYNLDGGIEGV